ncbi:MAG: 50S ribosomal protein L4 [Candidatus Auribacterota bacterium]|jgi:large subunit ribosomal protein L4|nr:50S ribosomal protein L4 [Candidatus Auribacterota bacterium]
MGKMDVCNINGDIVGSIAIDDTHIKYEPKTQAVHDVIVAYMANQRSGTASTKTRNEVSGSTKKPWRQKGTGRARAGTIRSPLWKGGGTVFGPTPRDYAKNITKKVKKAALASVFADKMASQSIQIIDEIKYEEPKTKQIVSLLQKLGILDQKVLILKAAVDYAVLKSADNIPGVNVAIASDVNVYEMLDCEKILIEKDAVEILLQRLNK